MKYNVGDKVRIKSLDWYNQNKDEFGDITFHRDNEDDVIFDNYHAEYCGEVPMIYGIVYGTRYIMVDDFYDSEWTDEMIEGLVEEETKFGTASNPIDKKSKANCLTRERVDETKHEPKFKVGDIIISDVFSTKDDKGWKVIDVERTGYKLISVNNPYLICDMDFKNEQYYKLVEEEVFIKANDVYNEEYSKGEYCHEQSFKWGFQEGYNFSHENDKLEMSLKEGYQFVDENGNVINATKIVLEKKKKEYPKTYEECCAVLRFHYDHYLTYDDEKDINPTKEEEEFIDLMDAFSRLIVCRNAYWKIYGEEMGLGKSWEPDWNNISDKYCIYFVSGYAWLKECQTRQCPFAFPTAEMRDYFYQYFNELIESVKELL
jgi:hypothetical protein